MPAIFHSLLMLEKHVLTIVRKPGLNPADIAATNVKSFTLATRKRN